MERKKNAKTPITHEGFDYLVNMYLRNKPSFEKVVNKNKKSQQQNKFLHNYLKLKKIIYSSYIKIPINKPTIAEFGRRIIVQNQINGQEFSYRIVGPFEYKMLNKKYLDQRMTPFEEISGFKNDLKDNFFSYYNPKLKNIYKKKNNQIYFEKEKNRNIEYRILEIFHYMHNLTQIK
ncbi:hypothetical protein HN415_09380 [Candidatus Woesearchaeota archaeon]|jgi:hypothetical protein|nr:hypothetical protein [Candidatus Woesearchaeota archaeon]